MRSRPQTTKIQKGATFRQRRQLAPGQIGTTTAHSGQEVSLVQVVARAELPYPFTVLELARQHRLSADDMEKGLLVEEGAHLRPGTPLLEKKRRFRKAVVIESPVEGIVEAIVDGRILVRRRSQEREIRALTKGWVVFTIQNQGVTIETRATRIEGLISSGQEGYGKLKLAAGSPSEIADHDSVLESAQGAVIGLGYLDSVDLVRAAIERGVRGFIIGSIGKAVFQALPRLGIPLIVTDGVGTQGMFPPIFETLGEGVGHEISLLAPAHSHSLRPLIIVPESAGKGKPMEEIEPELKVGDRVRLVRTPYAGEVGEIAALYLYPRGDFYFGPYVPTADVRLTSGDVILVPYSNLDIIM